MADEAKDLEFIDELEGSELSADGLSDEEKTNLTNDGHSEFGDEVSKDEDKSEKKDDQKKVDTTSKDDKKSEESSAAEKDQSDKDAEWQAKLDANEKRRSDTEKAFQKEHQEKLDLQRKLDKQKKESSLKKKKVQKPKDDADLLFGDEEPGIDPDGDKNIDTEGDSEIKEKLEGIEQKQEEQEKRQEELEKQRRLDVWEAEVEKVKVDKPDFNEVVYGVFHSAFETSPEVKAKFAEKGSTPAAAYEIGLELKGYKDALEGKKVEKKSAKVEEKDTEKEEGIDPTEALGGNSTGKSKPSTNTNDIRSDIDEALDFL